ncbi:MAG: hypothetical protein MJ246_08230 [Clostridia bacterium]|nr:hypothetical protein [Clostridia bacterium]
MISLLASNILGLVITFAIPVRRLSEKVSEQMINGFFKLLVDALITNVVYATIITACMVFTMSFVGNRAINMQISQRQEQLVKVNDSLTALESTGLQNGRIENYQKQQIQLNTEIEELETGRPEPLKTIWKTILASYILSVIVTMIAQPLWLKVAFRTYLHIR